uniref:3'-5' exonuclease domain-containing protein n=1 Tax=Piliocolobus tephrosceles TaxID=591936 RepID=A0A8C9GVT8_9PRIM
MVQIYKIINKNIKNYTLERTIANVSYGYLNLSVNDKIVHYFEELTKKKNIFYINNLEDCKKYIKDIHQEFIKKKINVIGLDIEGYKIGRYGIVSILQICLSDVYIFDLYKCDNNYLIIKYIKNLLENEEIIKVLHDCREDCSILYNQYNIKLNNVFDCQVAYNLFLKKTKKEQYQISYDDLLYKYLFLNNNNKIYFHKCISIDPKIYLERPISKELMHYAIQDVLYLKPLMLALVDKLESVSKDISLMEKKEKSQAGANAEVSAEVSTEAGTNNSLKLNYFKNSIIKDVINHSKKYINYQYLNIFIKNEKELQKGTIIEGMVVSCNNLNIYVKLNLNKKG